MNLINTEPTIFLICGKARHGKTTTGNFMREYYESNNKKVANTLIALYLKTYAEKFFGWDGNPETKPRELLQQLGTEIIRRKLNKENFFIDRTVEDIEILKHFFNVIIIDDIRFPLEINKIKENYNNVYAINIIRPDFDSDLSSEQKKHATETALDNYDGYDYTIINDADLETLRNKVVNIIEEVS